MSRTPLEPFDYEAAETHFDWPHGVMTWEPGQTYGPPAIDLCRAYVDPDQAVTDVVREMTEDRQINQPPASPFKQPPTGREAEVLAFIGQGWENKNIAQHLNISETTVKAHVSHLLEKLGATNRVQLALAFNGLPFKRGAA